MTKIISFKKNQLYFLKKKIKKHISFPSSPSPYLRFLPHHCHLLPHPHHCHLHFLSHHRSVIFSIPLRLRPWTHSSIMLNSFLVSDRDKGDGCSGGSGGCCGVDRLSLRKQAASCSTSSVPTTIVIITVMNPLRFCWFVVDNFGILLLKFCWFVIENLWDLVLICWFVYWCWFVVEILWDYGGGCVDLWKSGGGSCLWWLMVVMVFFDSRWW